MQLSGTAKDVPARMNKLSGIKTRLNSDPNHAGPMKEKTKTNWEHFCNNLFTLGKEKHVVQEQVYWCVMQGKEERDVVRQFYSNLQKRTQSRLVARIIQARITVIKNLNSFYLMDRRHTLRHTLGQNKPS